MKTTRFSDIPEGLVFNILLRLSVKSLKRLSCVNKSWYSLIHASSFVSQHYTYNSSNNAKLLVRSKLLDVQTRKYTFSLLSEGGDKCNHFEISGTPWKKGDNPLTVVTPCINGIICLVEYGINLISLWNPTTRENMRLPKCRLSYPRKSIFFLQALGFGWNSETDEYKVVMVVRFGPKKRDAIGIFFPSQAFVYSSSTNCWKQLNPEISFGGCYFDSSSSHVFINDTCLWGDQDEGIFGIFSFNVRDEVFGRIPMPNFSNGPNELHTTSTSLSVLDGCIALMKRKLEGTKCWFDIWVMVEYGVEQSWTHKFKIGPFPINNYGPFSKIEYGPQFFNDKGFFILDNNRKLLLVNFHTQEVKDLRVVDAAEVLLYVDVDLFSCSFQEDNTMEDIKNLYSQN